MLLSRSLWRKLVVTLVVMIGFVLVYEAQIFDSVTRQLLLTEGQGPDPSASAVRFMATAYCKGTVTTSGVAPRSGIAAADPSLLPVGSVIQLRSALDAHSGIYTVMDTGPKVRGRKLDIYMWSCHDALRFGRRMVDVVVLRRGWNPQATPPGIFEFLFNWGAGLAPSTSAAPAAEPPGPPAAPPTKPPAPGTR